MGAPATKRLRRSLRRAPGAGLVRHRITVEHGTRVRSILRLDSAAKLLRNMIADDRRDFEGARWARMVLHTELRELRFFRRTAVQVLP